MNVFNKFTIRSLKKNRSRTFVTIIGIALSMALITAIVQAVNSGLNFLITGETAHTGAFHGFYYNITEEEAKKVQADSEISDAAAWQQVGWAEIDSENESKPYLLIESISDNFTDLVSVNLTEGRMPESDYEIILPSHLLSDGGVSYNLGDIVSLNVGKRTSKGYELTGPYTGDEEEITDTQERKYTVVGFYERLDYSIEDFESPGYTALTTGGGSGSYYLFFTVKNPTNYFDYIMSENAVSDNCKSHYSLLAYSGSLKDENLSQVLYGFAAILILLISFGSILLIYNSFSISVSERTKQFGILKSVGATKKQIMRTVFFEALVLCAVAIPLGMIVGCLGIGITLYLLRDSFSAFISGADIKMYLVINVWGLVICAAVCLVTTLISAWLPARRAIKISPIDAIRQSTDVKMRRKDIRFKKIIYKLFGFEGMLAAKNFARNKKRYRSTVISLFLSVTLFISASSFCAYLTDSVDTVSATGHSDTDITYDTNSSNVKNPDQLLISLSSANGVDKVVYYRQSYFDAGFDLSAISDGYKKVCSAQADDTNKSFYDWCEIMFVNDEAFNTLCEENGIDKNKFYDKSTPQAVVFDEVNTTVRTDETHTKRIKNTVFKDDAFPISVNLTKEKEIEGYTLWNTENDENGDALFYYYPNEYIDSFNGEAIDEDQLDKDKAIVLSRDQAYSKEAITIGAKAENYPHYIPKSTMIFAIYPYSLMDSVLGEQFKENFFSYCFDFKAQNHSEAFKNIEQILSANGLSSDGLYDVAEHYESERTMVTVVNVFAYGFIILISLIAMANVFNTISTSISLRRREFAMLKSVGLTKRGFSKMMNFECIIYGIKGLFWGLIASLLVTYAIYQTTGAAIERSFYVPWYSVAIAVVSVFIVVFATMLYATSKIRKDNPIDALKNENL